VNQPTREEFEDLKRAVKKLEQDRDDLAQNERLLLRLAKYHRAAFQEFNAKFELEMGDVRERFDTLERGQQDLKQDVNVIKEDMNTVKGIVTQILELLQKK